MLFQCGAATTSLDLDPAVALARTKRSQSPDRNERRLDATKHASLCRMRYSMFAITQGLEAFDSCETTGVDADGARSLQNKVVSETLIRTHFSGDWRAITMRPSMTAG